MEQDCIRLPQLVLVFSTSDLGKGAKGEGGTSVAGPGVEAYRLSMSDTISTSSSAAEIFSAEESWGRPPNKKDMVDDDGC